VCLLTNYSNYFKIIFAGNLLYIKQKMDIVLLHCCQIPTEYVGILLSIRSGGGRGRRCPRSQQARDANQSDKYFMTNAHKSVVSMTRVIA